MDSNHSSYSSLNNSMAETETATAEESGWTAYFEDFLSTQQREHHHNSFTDHHHHRQHHHQQQQQQHDDQPVLSDAASHVEWNNMIGHSMSGAASNFSKKLNFIKKTSRRTREILYDDSLEDTASSPVNSPKVGSPDEMGFNNIKVDDITENCSGKGDAFGSHLGLQMRNDQSKNTAFEDNNNGSTDLRKRGLCLVPLSMFMNYV